ncbi:YeeE/YedE thiosulfate transporter family protein [Proteinivorax tanatarense]|uniref:YeeE/YedE thiosulfate transporter family protein n=1 Tax=Proteinivorax tanatarense TaxID=1260629 RepID=A0AAU7VPZ5_9FIRM
MKINKSWPYWLGMVLLAVINIALLAFIGSPWQITSVFLYWGIFVLNSLGFESLGESYTIYYGNGLSFEDAEIIYYLTILNIGIIAGSLLSALLSSEFKVKKIKNKKQLVLGIFGGVLMGFGARIALGCTIGGYFSAIPSFSLHGWVFAIFMFLGVLIGCKILYKDLI